MIKGEKVRLDVHNILYSIYKFNRTLNNPKILKIIDKSKTKDISFINNVTLNSMRLQFHTLKIIQKYVKKKLRINEKILLISAITQIVFLGFKEYAVINCTVEIAKKLKIYHGLVNSVLKRISVDKSKLKKTKIKFDDLPNWFVKKTSYFSKFERNKFINNFHLEPDIHVVFKSTKKLNNFEKKIIKTSDVSGFLENKNNIKNINSFVEGDWWVQDFSSFFPLNNLTIENTHKSFLDACAAPGGKAFQILSKNNKILLNDKNLFRIKTLKKNLKRLKFNSKIVNEDFTKFPKSEKFDFIVLDAPCSAVGTIRKNPEIFFKSEAPDFDYLSNIQEKMLDKASLLLNNNGLILYMVCSFLEYETKVQIDKFLNKNSNFKLDNFKLIKNSEYSGLVKNNLMITLPDKILEKNIDGYFAAYLKKIR